MAIKGNGLFREGGTLDMGASVAQVLFIETTDFQSFPAGGQRAFARQMMKAFGSRLALAGLSTDETPVGKWVRKRIDGVEYDYFAFTRVERGARRPVVPIRAKEYFEIRKHRTAILDKGLRRVFIRSQHLYAATVGWGWDSICYYFPGTENPLSLSRYQWARLLARVFDRWFLAKVAFADTVLAAADECAISELTRRSKGILSADRITSFPTRVDTGVFYSGNRSEERQKLGIPQEAIVLVTTGRIHWAKGWRLALTAFDRVRRVLPGAQLYFVGDGEDRQNLEAEIERLGLTTCVVVTGLKEQMAVAAYLRAANVFIMASEKEGWSTSLLEALASGLPIVSTSVSSASSIVRVGVNGYIVPVRDPGLFCGAVVDAVSLKPAAVGAYSRAEVEKYDVRYLARDLGAVWEPLAQASNSAATG